LTIHGDAVASDVVGAIDLGVFDDGDTPRRLLPCFMNDGSPATVMFSSTRAPAVAATADARAACVAGVIGAVDYDGGFVVRAALRCHSRRSSRC
jgi:hypothetical protein